MHFLLETARKDLRRRLRDPVALGIWVGIPLILGVLLSSIGGGGSAPTARLLVVDQDDSLLSGLLTGAGGQLGEVIEVEQVALDVGRERIDAGDASGLLIIPEGFGDAVLRQLPTELTLITNPAQQILPGILEEGLDILVDVVFYGQRIFGEELAQITTMVTEDGEGPDLEEVTALSTGIYQRMERLEGTLFPEPVLQIVDEPLPAAADEEEPEQEGSSLFRFFLPAMLFMSILFVAQGMSDDLWQESRLGTLRRSLTTPNGVVTLLAGKLLAGTVIMAGVGALALVIAAWQTGMSPLRLPLALLWLAYAGGVLLAYFFLLQSLATSQRGGNIVTTMVLFPVVMMGGSFFPFAAMPDWMAAIGAWTPNGLALLHLEEILWGAVDPAALAGAAAGIGLPAVLAFLLCARRLRHGPMVSA